LILSKDGLDYWIGADDLDGDGEWNWSNSGNPLIYTNWWTNAGPLKGQCAQLLKNGKTIPGKLDSFYWTKAAGKADCTSGDGDNGVICESAPNVVLP
jgi:hypothetical protein